MTHRDNEPIEHPYLSAPHIVRSRYSHAQWCTIDGGFALSHSTDDRLWRVAFQYHFRAHKDCHLPTAS